MGQFQIPLSMPGGFKNLEAAKKHREIVGKALALREQAAEAATDLKSVDRADIGSTPSDEWTDLADGAGHVIMVGDNEDGSVRGLELTYDTESGDVRRLEADVPEGKLTQTGDQSGNLSATYKWEEKNEQGEIVQVTQFRFDEARNTLSVTDPNNEVPAIFGSVDPKELVGGIFQQPVPILVEPSKGDIARFGRARQQGQGSLLSSGGLILPGS